MADFIPNARFVGGPCDGFETDIDLKGYDRVLMKISEDRGAVYILQGDETLLFDRTHSFDEFVKVSE